MSSHTTLDAAATDRKVRLSQLAALKRKQSQPASSQHEAAKSDVVTEPKDDVTTLYLSGRNYDPETKGPKLGFYESPANNEVTLEAQASRIATLTAQAAKDDEEVEKPIDLFKLQPKKPNWDLKRDLDEKLKVLNVRTENAIARLVRERIQSARRKAKEEGMDDAGEGQEELGIDGGTLVEGIHVREREEEEDAMRDREDAELT